LQYSIFPRSLSGALLERRFNRPGISRSTQHAPRQEAFMDLRDYPRPKGDTGIGVHWNAGFPAAVGIGQIRDVWLPELFALGVKWVKISRHDGGLELAELLLKHDILPIVRIYRPQPNPGVLDDAARAFVKDYVAAGVRYFEFNNEPDLTVEWQNGYLPPDAAQVVARNAIVDMEAILKLGGYPGLPALAVGCKWDLAGEICKLGRRDLLGEPVWQALHNYSINHPLDYPGDAGNQTGAAYTQEFYDRLATEAWDGQAWEGWSLDRINAERRDHSNPGATAFDDPSCWRAYERYDRLIRDQIGRSLPILATENGYIVAERPDPRYPATTPQLHAAQTLEACRIMMGTSSRFDHAPDYYFCTAFWLLGNYTLGHWAQEWEGQAWYSDRWPNGQLPIVAALKAEPKQARPWRGDSGLGGRVAGTAQGGAGLTVRLSRADGWSLTGRIAADGRFEFADVPLDSYRVTVIEAARDLAVTLTRERPAATANFDLTGIVFNLVNGSIAGKVRGGAGMTVGLARSPPPRGGGGGGEGGGQGQQQTIAADGSYRFTDLPAGTYVLALIGTDVARAGIVVDGRSEVTVDLAAPGWGWEAQDGGASPGFGVVRCRVTAHPPRRDGGGEGGVVRLWTAGWQGMTQRTGSKPEYGPDACEFAPLGAGVYSIQPEGIEVVAQVTVDGSRILWVNFAKTTGAAVHASTVAGRVRNGADRTLTLRGPHDEQTTRAGDDGSYRFEGLAAGIYRVAVTDSDVAQDGIVLDGHNHVTVNLALPIPTAGAIFGVIANGAGRSVRLLPPAAAGLPPPTVPPVATGGMQGGPDGSYRFEGLPPGVYTIQVAGETADAPPAAERTGIVVDGIRSVRVDLSLPAPAPAARWIVEDGGAGPGFAVVRCRAGEPDREVRLWTPGWGGITQRGGSKAEYGPDACEFAPLGAGTYLLEAAGIPLRAEVQVAANRVTWVRFEAPPVPTGGEEGGGQEAPPPPEVDLPAPARADSVLRGRVKGGADRQVILEGPAGLSKTTTAADDEHYSFTGLPAGVYRAIIPPLAPGGDDGVTQAGIQLDGANCVTVDFDLNALGPDKTRDHYLLVGSLARSKEDFLAVLRYVARFQPAVGGDEAEARQARHVTILGGANAISAVVEQGLRLSGCQVQRIESDYAARLGRLINEGRPY
jgi:hypothetical protein